jgi:glycine/D-amino acid oxidase-like deaminating enzyme
MTNTEFLIVGQGISGTFVSWYLHKAGRQFVVIDNNDIQTASRVAAGIINPVTGRRVVRTWMIETLMPFAIAAYREIGDFLGIDPVEERKIIDFFPSLQMKLAFEKKIREGEEFLSLPANENDYLNSFKYDLGYGVINTGYIVNLKEVLAGWKSFLVNKDLLFEDNFDDQKLDMSENFRYEGIVAEKIIFCDGIYSSTNKFFKKLPFALNKGEALIIETDAVPQHAIFKKGLTLVPFDDSRFWVGSSHEWDFIDNLPSDAFLEQTKKMLSGWVNGSFTVVDRLAAIRPATVERRPFVGMHPHFPAVGILNGMGTKGCSLAPFFANQLVNNLTNGSSISPEADITRFSRILQPTS